jgi:tetratricopeptide (TPR) repeat protein
MILILFPFQIIFALCKHCQFEMEAGDTYLIANRTLREAKKLGLSRPKPRYLTCDWISDFLENTYSYSRYRRKFEYLLEYAEEDFADCSLYVNNDIQESTEKIARLQASMDPDLKSICYYQSRLDQKNSYLQKIAKELPVIQSTLSQGLTEITRACEQLYTLCIEEHNDKNSFYERGLTYYDQGKFLESIGDISKFLDTGQMIPNQDNPSELYLAQGRCYSDLALYDQAIEALTEAIHANPENKEAYLERAGAYFEIGDFDSSIQDYLTSGFRTTPIDSSKLDLALGFIIGASSGIQEALVEFIPGLLNSAKGLSSALWSIAITPQQFSQDMFHACNSLLQFLANHPNPEILEAISPKLKALFYDRDSLTSQEKGEYLGYLLSKNGVELFGAVGAMKVYQQIRRANMLMTLETLAISKPKVIEKSAEWAAKHAEVIKKMRADEAFVKSLRKQNLSESTIRKTLHELGKETFPRPKGVPENFIANFSEKNFGMMYIDPSNKQHYIRVMPGEPKSPNLKQQKPYVIHRIRDDAVDIAGEKVHPKSEFAHIDLEEYIYRAPDTIYD